MASENNPWIKRSDVVGALTVAAILWMVGILREWYTTAPVLATFKQWLDLLGKGLLNIGNSEFKLWWLVAFFILFKSVPLIYVFYKQKRSHSDVDRNLSIETQVKTIRAFRNDLMAQSAKEEKMLAYTADKFYGFTWVWRWVKNKRLFINEPKYIAPCCPNPQCEQNTLESPAIEALGVEYTCSKCKQQHSIPYGGLNIIHSVEEQIDRKVATF